MAEFHLLHEGYLSGADDDITAATVSFVRDEDALIVIDPGLVPSRSAILEPLAALGVEPDDVTEVVISHHHPDHALNIALFPRAGSTTTGPGTGTTCGSRARPRAWNSARPCG